MVVFDRKEKNVTVAKGSKKEEVIELEIVRDHSMSKKNEAYQHEQYSKAPVTTGPSYAKTDSTDKAYGLKRRDRQPTAHTSSDPRFLSYDTKSRPVGAEGQ